MSTENGDGPRVDRWRDVFSRSYGYPEDIDQSDPAESPGRKTRKTRRQSRKEWRRADYEARREFIARQRREEPVSSEARLGCVAVIAVVAVVLIIAATVRGCTSEQGEVVPSPTPVANTGSSPATQTSSPTPETATVTTPTQIQAPEAMVTQWAEAWFSYTPTRGDSQNGRMDRTYPFMTDELTAFLNSSDDASAKYFEDNGLDAEVTNVQVEPPPEGFGAPADHDTRKTFIAKTTSVFTAGARSGEEFTDAYAVTLLRGDIADPWKVGQFEVADH